MICRIVYKPDKSVVVIHYAPKSTMSPDIAFQKAMKNMELENADYEDVEDSTLPSREFRNAWEGEKGKSITINEVKKQAIIEAKNMPTTEDRIKALEEKTK